MLFASGMKVVLKFFDLQAAKTFLNAQHNWNKRFQWLNQGITEDYGLKDWHGLGYMTFQYNRSDENIIAIINIFGKVLVVDGQN